MTAAGARGGWLPAGGSATMQGMDPLSEPTVRSLVQRYAGLLRRHGAELGVRPLVLPTGRFFPDHFDSDERSACRLVERMKAHAGLDDVPTRVRVVPAEAPPDGAGGCSSGACTVPASPQDRVPRLVEEGDGWCIQIPEAELGHPIVLTALLARVLGHVFLAETVPEGQSIDRPIEITADLAAVALGFGALLLEGAYIYSKSCGGPQIGRVTALGVQELALATAIFASLGGHSMRAALRELSVTQRTALKEAHEWVKSNRPLLDLLGSDPARASEGSFELSEPTPWLLRVLGKKRRAGDASPSFSEEALEQALKTLPTTDTPRRAPRPLDPKRDELKALVEEALQSPAPQADAE